MFRRFTVAALLLAATVAGHGSMLRTVQALRIVVLEGEDAVNIIQQRTAVAPLVEVRDVNNLPVAGATVTFSVGGGASFGGASSLTVVTNAAGQAAAKGLVPTLPGPLQVQVTAVYQGQKAAATIAQTNFMTASQATAASGASAGAGGGISGKTIAIIGGVAAAGGAGAAIALGGGSEPPTVDPDPDPVIIIPPVTTTTTTSTTTTTTTSTTTTTLPPTCTAPTLRSISGAPAGTGATVDQRDNFVDISVVTNCPWTTSSVPSWIQPDPNSGGSGTTNVRIRVNANNTSSPRSAEIRFVAGTSTTSFVINQDAPPQPITYTGNAGSVTLNYSPTSGNDGLCTYTTTISSISASITALGENLTAGQVTLTANETGNIYCTSPAPLGSSNHVYTLRSGTIRNNSLDSRFDPASGNRPRADLTLTGTRSGGTIDATLTLSRTDSSGALNWRATQRIILTAR